MKTHRIFAVVAGFTTAIGFLAFTVPSSSAATSPAGAAQVWRIVSAGGAHTCAIQEDSTLWCWGNGSQGALGNGGEANENSPVPVVGGSAWSVVNTGLNHTCGVQSNGSLWCWGANDVGQLGLGDTGQRLVPTQVGTEDDWSAVSSGSEHTCAVKDDGTLWCWGDQQQRSARSGQLHGQPGPAAGRQLGYLEVRQGRRARHLRAHQRVRTVVLGRQPESGSSALATRIDREVPVQVSGLYAKVSLTSNHTCAIEDTSSLGGRVSVMGPLWCWGLNNKGQLGIGSRVNQSSPAQVGSAADWVGVGPGLFHTCAINESRHLFCWGLNTFGQLGLGNPPNLHLSHAGRNRYRLEGCQRGCAAHLQPPETEPEPVVLGRQRLRSARTRRQLRAEHTDEGEVTNLETTHT